MRALSINQPWAWLIVHGFKDIENRDWPTDYRGTVLIHAGIKMSDDAFLSAQSVVMGLPEDILSAIRDRDGQEKCTPRLMRERWMGGIVGQADIVDCVKQSDSPWFFGEYGFVLKNQVAFEKMIPCKGALGFFTPDYNSVYVGKKQKHREIQAAPSTQEMLL